MATIGVLVPPWSGHLNPMNALGRELVRRGHRVIVPLFPDAETSVAGAGLEFVPIGEDEYPLGAVRRSDAELGGLSGRAALKYTLGVLAPMSLTIQREALPVFREAATDLILVDMAVPLGCSVPEHLGLPFVSVANALPFNVGLDVPPVSTTRAYSGTRLGRLRNLIDYAALPQFSPSDLRAFTEQRRAWGLSPIHRANDALSPFAQVSQEPPEFEFPRYLPPHFHFAGPFHDPTTRAPVPFPFDALDGRPLVYASMGTLQNRLSWIFRAIAEACADLDVQLVLSLGGSAAPDSLGRLPGAPIVVEFAPQLELLSRARLTVTHGGLNTTLESLRHGVPLVVIPITNDQPGVAARVEWTKTGLVVPPSILTASRLREAVSRVLDSPEFAGNARRLQAAIGRLGGVRHAADVIERVLTTRRPVCAESFERIPPADLLLKWERGPEKSVTAVVTRRAGRALTFRTPHRYTRASEEIVARVR